VATITSAQTGVFSDPATWVGGVVPMAADIAVAATGHVVTLDTDVTVEEVQQAGTGHFILGDGRILTALVRGNAALTASLLGTVICTAATWAEVVGDVVSSNTTNSTTALRMQGSGELTITGTVSTSSSSRFALRFVFGSVTIIGTVMTNNNLGNAVSVVETASSLTIVGSVKTGSSASTPILISVASTTVCVVHITGVVESRASSSSTTTLFSVTSGIVEVTILGDLISSGQRLVGFSNAHAGTTLTVVGTVQGQHRGAGCVYIGGPWNIPVYVVGNVIAQGRYAAIHVAVGANSTVHVTGDIFDSLQGYRAVFTRNLRVAHDTDGVSRFAVSPLETGFTYRATQSLASSDQPSYGDVYEGYTYNFGALEGELAVPDPMDVAFGVPVGNTMGSATLTPTDVWSFPVVDAVEPGSTGEKFLQANTADIVDGVMSVGLEQDLTLKEALRLVLAATIGKVTSTGNVVTFRDPNDLRDRIVAEVNTEGERLSVDVNVY